jgi:hypothetical protein
MNALHCTLLSLFGAALAAQNVTSPAGYFTTDGGSGANDMVGAYANQYTHLVDVDQAFISNGARSLRALWLRRDAAAPTNAAYTARAIPVQVNLAHVDFSRIINGEAVDDANMRLSPWQTSFSERMVSMPSFVNQPAGVAPWQLSFPLDTPYAYNASGALAIHVRFGFNPNFAPANYPLDFTGEFSEAVQSGVRLAGACQVAGRPAPMDLSSTLFNYGDIGSQTVLRCVLQNGVASAPWVLLLGLTNPNAAIGACAALRTSAELIVGGEVTSTTGYSNLAWSFPHQPHLVGANFFLQAAQIDGAQAGLPVALTNGTRQPYPQNPALPPHAFSVSWSPSNSLGTVNTFYKGGTLVFGVGY